MRPLRVSADDLPLACPLGVPAEAHRVELLRRLLDEGVVLTHEPESAQCEWACVGAVLDPERSVCLDTFPLAERDERVEEWRPAEIRPRLELLLVEAVDETPEILEIASGEGNLQSRRIEEEAVALHPDALRLTLEAKGLLVVAREGGGRSAEEQRLDVEGAGSGEVRLHGLLAPWPRRSPATPRARQAPSPAPSTPPPSAPEPCRSSC